MRMRNKQSFKRWMAVAKLSNILLKYTVSQTNTVQEANSASDKVPKQAL
jgi:hypothetical protein